MTIALGFQCMDGVVLCADREISKTGGLKYPERKIFSATIRGTVDAVLAMTYCNNPDIAKSIFDRMVKTIPFELGKRKELFLSDKVAGFLKDSVPRGDRRYVEMLIVFAAPNHSPTLFVIRDGQVLRATRECVGAGDTSLFRYISELTAVMFTTKQSVKLGLYLALLASRFVSGCGSGIDATIVHSHENIEEVKVQDYIPSLAAIDNELKEILLGQIRKEETYV